MRSSHGVSVVIMSLCLAAAGAGCASEQAPSELELEEQDALLAEELDQKELKEQKEKKRADLLAKQEEEKANPNRRVLIGKLWNSTGPVPDDVVQNMSDCYFAAGVASVAHMRPDHIQRNIVPRYKKVDGVETTELEGYNVTLGDISDEKLGRRDEVIEIEASLPLSEGGTAKNAKLLFGRGGNGTFWFPMIERAFAYQKGGYDKIGAYGMAGAALARVTGHRTRPGLVSLNRKEAVWKRLSNSVAEKQPLVACTVLRKPLPGMTDKHCNGLVGVEEVEGQRWVKMYNSRRTLFMPTETARAKENTATGYLWLSLEEFTQAYDYMTYTVGM